MFLRIETISEKKLIGISETMSFAQDKTQLLWQAFMQQRNIIKNRVNQDFISLQQYPEDLSFETLDIHKKFTKWAGAEVSDFDQIPEGMHKLIVPAGLYAVFLHKGAAPTAQKTFAYIFEVWLPQSGYQLDIRPHFEVLGSKYRNNDPDSEEEIFIPIVKND